MTVKIRRKRIFPIFYSKMLPFSTYYDCYLTIKLLFFFFYNYRASELAFALAPLPKDELPPSPPFTEVRILQNPFSLKRVFFLLFNIMLYFIMLLDVFFFVSVQSQEDAQDLDALTLAKSYFDLKEYDRAAYFLKGCCSQKSYFLYMYSRYLVSLYSLNTYTLILDSFSGKLSFHLGSSDFFSLFSQVRKRKMMRLWTAWVRILLQTCNSFVILCHKTLNI